MTDVAVNIARKMKELGLSQNRLAKISGVTQSAISSILNETKSPSVETVRLIAGALGCTISDLFGETDNNPQQLFTEYERQLLLYARQLNRQGMDQLLTYARDLTENERYTKDLSKRKAE